MSILYRNGINAEQKAFSVLPKLLMFDEPSLGLAPILVQDMFSMIRRINDEEGVTVLLVEQNVTQTHSCYHALRENERTRN